MPSSDLLESVRVDACRLAVAILGQTQSAQDAAQDHAVETIEPSPPTSSYDGATGIRSNPT
jgi:hypothetical protein